MFCGTIANIKQGLGSVGAKIYMREIYLSTYGIYNGFSPTNRNRSMGSSAMFDAEDINNGSLYIDSSKAFIDSNFHKLWGLNWLEYMSLPSDIIDMLVKIGTKEMEKKDTAINNLMDNLPEDIKNN